MDAWPASEGEAIHTSTFLGNPLACAAGIASLREIERRGLVERSASEGELWIEELRTTLARHDAVGDVRGRGLMIGMEFFPEVGGARPYCEKLKRKGLLCKETHDNIIRFAPPLVIDQETVDWALERIEAVLRE